MQRVVPFAFVQASEQAPQLSTSARTSDSQPFLTSPSQSSNPGSQSMLQVWSAQEGVPFSSLQTVSHMPQDSTAVRSISQPLAGSESQSARPAAHPRSLHTPPLQ